MMQPNYDLPDPIRSVWELRKGDTGSQLGKSRASNMSRSSFGSSVSPKKKIPVDFHQRNISPVKKTIPRQSSQDEEKVTRFEENLENSNISPKGMHNSNSTGNLRPASLDPEEKTLKPNMSYAPK